MRLTERHYEEISECFPKHRKAAGISNLEVLNALIYMLKNGCPWRSLPKEYGNWHTIYTRIRRWAEKGVLQAAFFRLQEKGIIQVNVSIISMDSTNVKVHPDGMGALKKEENSLSGRHGADGTLKFIWLPHLTGRQ